MTLEEAANAVRLYVMGKEYDNSPHSMVRDWRERLDDCLADIRAELADATECDDKWSRYLDLTAALISEEQPK